MAEKMTERSGTPLSEREALAAKLAGIRPGWLPVVGPVVAYTFTPAELEMTVKALRSETGQRDAVQLERELAEAKAQLSAGMLLSAARPSLGAITDEVRLLLQNFYVLMEEGRAVSMNYREDAKRRIQAVLSAPLSPRAAQEGWRTISEDVYEDVCEYLRQRQDTRDGSDGTPLPNEAMSLLFRVTQESDQAPRSHTEQQQEPAGNCAECGHGNRLNGRIVHASTCSFYGKSAARSTPVAPTAQTPHHLATVAATELTVQSSIVAWTWEQAAHHLGEQLCSTGPQGYYEFTPWQWLHWCEKQLSALRSARGTKTDG